MSNPDPKARRAELIRLAMTALRGSGTTATGATMFMPDGSVVYLSAENANAMTGTGPAKGRV